MIFFKGCPKCGGDLYLDSDIYGDYLNCLQCGYAADLAMESRAVATDCDHTERVEAA